MRQKPIPAILQKNKLVLSLLGGSLFILALLFLKSTISEYTNDGTVAISADQTMYFGTNFNNSNQGLWQNEGEIFFQQDLSNYGDLNCGSCLSGVNYFNDDNQQLQKISGSEKVVMYDVVLNNSGNLQIQTELEIVNSFQFQNGSLIGDLSNPSTFLHFQDNASYTGLDNARHVVGYVGKTGDDSFIFPIGDGSRTYPIVLTGSAPGDFFKAAYFPVNPGSTTFSNGSAYNTSDKEGTIHTVHTREFWDIDGSTPTVVTFEWDSDNGLNTLLSDIIDLVVAGWDGTQWVSLGQNNLTGSVTAGSIKTDPLIPDNYLAFTFARVNAGTFPVEWLSLSVEKSQENALLRWSTAQEISSDRYEIERSPYAANGFSKIGEIQAGGNRTEVSHYSFIDSTIANFSNTHVYYRLRQIDLDGGFSYSSIVELERRDVAPPMEFSLFPNPAREFIMLDIGSPHTHEGVLEIMNLEGKTLLRRELRFDSQVKIDLEGIPAGTFLASLTTEAHTYTRKFFKR